MNKVIMSGKVFKIQKHNNMTTCDLMFSFDKETQKGKFIKIKAFKAAHEFLTEEYNKKYLVITGWLDKDEYINKDGNKIGMFVICTTQIEEIKQDEQINYDDAF